MIKIAESLRIKGLGDVSQRDPASSPPPPSIPQFHHQQYHHTSAQYTTSAKHNKRAVSPNNDTSSFNNTSNCGTGNSRSKKIPRRSYQPSTMCNNTSSTPSSASLPPSVGMDDGLKAAAAAAGVFLPDLTTALLTAASSYTHGLSVNFPAFAAVSAAAAAEYNRQVR